MAPEFWHQVQRTGFGLPDGVPLDELTAELTGMLGSTDPAQRDGTAYPALMTWIARGTYDDLLGGLGDGMVAGLGIGLGESGTDTVFRRSWSALVLKECLLRDASHRLLPGDKVLEWGDHLATWLLEERDTRGEVPGMGRANAIGHGAEAIGALARSPHLSADELVVLLDVLGQRLILPATPPLGNDDLDRVAAAVMEILRRDLVALERLEPWVARVASEGPQSFLRSFFVQLSLAGDPPALRPDLLLVLVDALRMTNAGYL